MEENTDLTTREAAVFLKAQGYELAANQVAQLAAAEAFPNAHKPDGRIWRIPERDLLDYIHGRQRKRRWLRGGCSASVIIALLALVVAIPSGMFDSWGLLEKIVETIAPSDNLNENISVDYARLFGAWQGPFFLTGDNIPTGPCGGYPLYIIKTDRVENFWATWEYRSAKPVMTKVWRELFGCDVAKQDPHKLPYGPGQLLSLANGGDPVAAHFLDFLSEEDLSEILEECEREEEEEEEEEDWNWELIEDQFRCYAKQRVPEYTAEEVLERVKSNSLEIGFLVLYVTNSSDKEMVDVTLEYREFARDIYAEPFDSASFVEEDLQQAELQKQRLLNLAPGEQVNLLLSIYEKDANGYPKSYISSVMRPEQLSYRIRRSSEVLIERIRLPLRDQALKVPLPFGWHGQ